MRYSLRAFERLLPSLAPSATVAVHDTGLHVLDHGTQAPREQEGLPFTAESCRRAGHCGALSGPGCKGWLPCGLQLGATCDMAFRSMRHRNP